MLCGVQMERQTRPGGPGRGDFLEEVVRELDSRTSGMIHPEHREGDQGEHGEYVSRCSREDREGAGRDGRWVSSWGCRNRVPYWLP